MPPTLKLEPDLSPDANDRRMLRSNRLTDVGNRILAFSLAQMDENQEYQVLGFSSTVEYAMRRLGMGRRRACELRQVGRELRDLRSIDEAFGAGKLLWSSVRLLVRVATRETEEEWLKVALALTIAELKRRVAAGEKGRPPRADGLGLPTVKMTVGGRLSVLDHEKWLKAQQKLEAERGMSLTTAEMMAELAEMCLQSDEPGTLAGRRPVDHALFTIVVNNNETGQALVRTDAGPIELASEETELLACDTLREMHPEGQGERIKKDRPVSPALRRLVLARDNHRCVKCGHGRGLQAHHIIWRKHGGLTVLWNLTTLCGRCHALVHEGLIILTGKAPDGLTITDKDGQPLEGHPAAEGLVLEVPERPAVAEPATVVTFRGLPGSADDEWLRKHAHLLKWCDRERSFVFTPGAPRKVEEFKQAGPGVAPDHRPATLDRVIGQERVVSALVDAAATARKCGCQVDHVLLTGQAGLGKTSLAQALAVEMGARLHQAEAPLLNDPGALIKLLIGARSGDVIFLDEIHALPRASMEVLYTVLEDNVLRLRITDGHVSRSLTVTLPPLTIVGATTESDRLLDPLISRFVIRESLEFYSMDQLVGIVLKGALRLELPLNRAGAMQIAGAARGVPRDALSLLSRVRNRAVAKDLDLDTSVAVLEIMKSIGIDAEGLGPMERKILAVLEKRGTAMGARRLAAAVGLTRRTLIRVYEPFLLRCGRLTFTPLGRMAVASAG